MQLNIKQLVFIICSAAATLSLLKGGALDRQDGNVLTCVCMHICLYAWLHVCIQHARVHIALTPTMCEKT